MSQPPPRATHAAIGLSVFGFLGLALLLLTTPMCCGPSPAAEITAAPAQIYKLNRALQTCKDHNRAYPATLAELVAPPPGSHRTKPFVEAKDLLDPWGQPFLYRPHPGATPPYDLYSSGPDLKADTDDDVWP